MRNNGWLRRMPKRLWAVLAALLLFTFLSNDFGLVDLQKTAIVLAAGIDRSEEGFSVTAQIAVPKGSDRTTGGTSSVELTGTGGTVADCFSAIYAQTGWLPKLVFCDLLLLGEDAARAGAFGALDYFLRDEYAPDSCTLAVCEGSASALLRTASAVDDASSLALETLFSDAAKKAGRIRTTTLREFCITSYGASACGYMPYVRITDPGRQSADGAAGGGNAGGKGEKQADAAKEAVFDASQTALFSHGKMTGLATAQETFAMSLVYDRVYGGSLAAGGATLTVLKNDGGVSFPRDPAPAVRFSVKLSLALADRSAPTPPTSLAAGTVPPETVDAAKAEVTAHLAALWARCVQADCDLFLFRRTLFRHDRALYAQWKDRPLEDLPAYFTIEAESLR